jgi:hypothetical protein
LVTKQLEGLLKKVDGNQQMNVFSKEAGNVMLKPGGTKWEDRKIKWELDDSATLQVEAETGNGLVNFR